MSDPIIEESASQGIQIPIQRFSDLQGALHEIAAEAKRQKDRCTSLRAERKNLEASIASIHADIAALKSQRDDLRLDLVAEKDAIARWTAREASVPADTRSKADVVGRAVRRAHLFEIKLEEADARVRAAHDEAQAEVQQEQQTAQGLRERIGRLEGRLKAAEGAQKEGEQVLQETRRAVQVERQEMEKERAKWAAERGDLLEARDLAKEEVQRVKKELEAALEAKREAVEQARRVRVSVADGLAAQQGPTRPLTPLKSNIAIPITPTRSVLAHNADTNRSPSKTPGIAALTPASLARRHTYLEGRYAVLQKEYEQLKAKCANDTRKWTDFKAAMEAREEVKRQRRAKRRSERVAAGSGAADASASASGEAVSSGGGIPATMPPLPEFGLVGGPTQREAGGARAEVLVEASDESAPMDAPKRDGGAARRPEATHTTRDATSAEGPEQHQAGFGRDGTDGQTTEQAQSASARVATGASAAGPVSAPSHPATVHVPAAHVEEEYEEQEYCSPADAAFSNVASQAAQLHRPAEHHDPRTSGPAATSAMPERRTSPRTSANVGKTPSRVLDARAASELRPTTPAFNPAVATHVRRSARKDFQPPPAPAAPPSAQRLPAAPLARFGSRGALDRSDDCTTPRPAVVQPSRTTPWLGKAVPVGRTTSRSNIVNTRANDDDPFASPPDAGDVPETTATTAAHKLLIRDRGAGMGTAGTPDRGTRFEASGRNDRPETLLRTALRGSKSGTIAMVDGVGGPENGSPSAAGPSTRTKRKRSDLDVDLSTLSPAEKAAHLKRLGKLSAEERREVYGGYKGKGRYLAPEDVHSGVGEQYEIDPKLNEGQTHMFHDVKRKRDERSKMHGGDCECCREYYQAIGDIPRFNQGPKWNDAPDRPNGGAGAEARVRDHQNLVSRHRETWIKGSTPPGFWSIGFPSTQQAAEQNRLADEMEREKAERIRKEVE